MHVAGNATEAGGAMPPATVRVWDPFVRVFHWSLVALFIGAFVTGDEATNAHVAIGYGIAALLALRVVWGFIGPRHARFSDFARSPREVMAYVRDVALMKAPRHVGHNPAGGAMILALILMLAATCATGVAMTTSAFWGSKIMEEVHEVLANATVALIVLHVAGVAIASLMHRENLVKAMFTGRKRAV